MILAHRIRLVPTDQQAAYFARACGVARFAYNWTLAEWQRQYAAGEKPSEVSLRRQLNAIKHSCFPWMREVTKFAPKYAIKNLGRAYANFFADLAKYRRGDLPWKRVRKPRFKKKSLHDSFRADNGTDKAHSNAVRVEGKRVKLAVIGWVAMREEVRFAGRISSVTILHRADAWYASFAVETDYTPKVGGERGIVGVDLGITNLATLSDGSDPIPAPKPLRRYLRKLERLSRGLSRKQRGSRNRAKAKTKLARLHRRIADIRVDALHGLTTRLTTQYGTIVIEDLNVSGMLGFRRLSSAIRDVGFFEFRRQLGYKAAMTGSTILVADRWYPSSKLCSSCNVKNEALTLSDRTWTCASCGTFHDRDANAARNLARYPESWAGSACGADGSGGEAHLTAKPAAEKQEGKPGRGCPCFP